MNNGLKLRFLAVGEGLTLEAARGLGHETELIEITTTQKRMGLWTKIKTDTKDEVIKY